MFREPEDYRPLASAEDLWVVVPAYNEADIIVGTLCSLAEQTDLEFRAVIVDNGSTDQTRRVVSEWVAVNGDGRFTVIDEPCKGTGSAADTGFRYAIDQGADWIARTDADCIVAPTWTEAVRRAAPTAHMIGGKIRPRTDEGALTLIDRVVLPAAVELARLFGRVRPMNRSAGFLCPDVMCVGNNLAIEANTYVDAGGFPRLAIEELAIPNDRALVNEVRRCTPFVRYVPDMVVYNSIRRVRAYGLIRTLRWYMDHSLEYDRFEVDVR